MPHLRCSLPPLMVAAEIEGLPWLLPPVLHSSLPNFSTDHRLALALRITTPAVRFDPAGLKEKGLQNLVKTVVLRGEDGERLNDQLRYDT